MRVCLVAWLVIYAVDLVLVVILRLELPPLLCRSLKPARRAIQGEIPSTLVDATNGVEGSCVGICSTNLVVLKFAKLLL